jgi:argininosuccinate lyase
MGLSSNNINESTGRSFNGHRDCKHVTRLWDKGAPLDDRVLNYTAGEDYALDERLVRDDVRASIAHAEMLHEQKLLSAGDLEEIRAG